MSTIGSNSSIPFSESSFQGARLEAETKREREVKEEANNQLEDRDPLLPNLSHTARMQQAARIAAFWKSEEADPLRHSQFPRNDVPSQGLSEEQRRIVKIFDQPPPPGGRLSELEWSTTTAFAYFTDHPKEVASQIINHATESACGGGVAGGYIGGGLGVMAGNVKAGIKIGAAVGAAIGVVIAFPMSISDISMSAEYQLWKLQRERMLTDKQIAKFFDNDETLKRLVCDITKKVPVMPVCVYWADQDLYSELTFEQDQILAWIRANPRKLYPGINQHFTEEDLIFDIPYVNGVRERLQQLKVDIERLTPEGALQNTINDSLRDIPPDVNNIMGEYLQNQRIHRIAQECMNKDAEWRQCARPQINHRVTQLDNQLKDHDISETIHSQEMIILERYITSVRRVELMETNWFLKYFFGYQNYIIKLVKPRVRNVRGGLLPSSNSSTTTSSSSNMVSSSLSSSSSSSSSTTTSSLSSRASSSSSSSSTTPFQPSRSD